MMTSFKPQIKIGILGGGQLGRMLLQAAIDFDLEIHVLDPDHDAPCRNLAHCFVCGSFQDFDTVYAFGKTVDVLTIEIEKVNVEALERLEAEGIHVFPQPNIIRIIQDKRLQKQFFIARKLPTADFILTQNRADAQQHNDFLPAFHKLGKDGYDGRGVQYIGSESDINKAFDAPGLLEKAVDFTKELAVIVARSTTGEVQTFPIVEMVFNPFLNLVEYLFSPAEVAVEIAEKAKSLAIQTAEAFGIVGILAVEMFLLSNDEILINEVAPRPHNSGHHTIRANDVSQFEQHLRAILGLPLGSTQAHGMAAMVNLLGEDNHTGEAYYQGMNTLLAIQGIHPFLYGKRFTKPFRKMGHVTVLGNNLSELRTKIALVQQSIQVLGSDSIEEIGKNTIINSRLFLK